MRRDLLAGLGFILVLASARPALSLELESLCWRDYPIPVTAVNYKKAFASETLAPDPISINGKVVTTGITEKTLDGVLGVASTVVEDWQQRSDQEQCDYLLELLRQHANTMHLYKLGVIKLKKLSGLFRVVKWQLAGVGTLGAFLHKRSAAEPEAAYLYHLTLLPVPLDKVKRKKGKGYVLTKPGTPKIEWNTETNRLSISTQPISGDRAQQERRPPMAPHVWRIRRSPARV
jgi:hypothetical protein